MKLLIAFLISTHLAQFTFAKALPEPTFDCILPLIAIGAAAFGQYSGALGNAFVGSYPYNGGVVYGGPSYGASPYYGGGPYGGTTYPGVQYNRGTPYYGIDSFYDYF
ncbi:hypothetical protein Bhyg_14566 [Pseudolycoriella hygida]|uniref:Uncharacterized protein n=1 Tax=Pseudolycoriella hygida TaxID=35572 RepID=A0A9Q0RVR8_9DIPT|nr:hypothetical protein Bhyg_14566 [Pseudolycoriella hygida]